MKDSGRMLNSQPRYKHNGTEMAGRERNSKTSSRHLSNPCLSSMYVCACASILKIFISAGWLQGCGKLPAYLQRSWEKPEAQTASGDLRVNIVHKLGVFPNNEEQH